MMNRRQLIAAAAVAGAAALPGIQRKTVRIPTNSLAGGMTLSEAQNDTFKSRLTFCHLF